jgi:hypothetical protein
MFQIDGLYAPGNGFASKELPSQIPLIVPQFPEIAGCFLGTINLILDRPLLVVKPDHRTMGLTWRGDPAQQDAYDFLRIEFEGPIGAPAVKAWLYIPHRATHRKHLNVHEVLAPTMLPISHGDRCRIRIHRPVEELPYQKIAVVL